MSNEEQSKRRHTIAIIGLGKIAQDQHVPVITANPAFELVAVCSQRGLGTGAAAQSFRTHDELLDHIRDLDAVAISTPLQVRHQIARDAL